MIQSFLFPVMAIHRVRCFRCYEEVWQERLESGRCPACRDVRDCDHCGREFPVRELHIIEETAYYHEEAICETCRHENFLGCSCCNRNNPCHVCRQTYFRCRLCNEWRHEDCRHGSDVCRHCSKSCDRLEEFLPDWKPHGKGRHFGVEMEFECPQGTRRATRDALHDHFGQHAALQEDSSLVNGIEVATQPATHALQVAWWEEFYSTGIPDDVDVSRRCGMHVHIERDTITPLTLGKMMVFLNRVENRKFICKMAGREFIYNGDYKDEVKLTDKGKHKYEALNTLNRETLEIRIFAATLDKVECLGRLEFVVALVDHCQVASMNALDTPSFLRWLGKQPHYPYLREYLKN